MAGIPQNSYTYGANSDWTAGIQIANGPSTLDKIVVNTASACTIGIIDGTSGTTVNVGKLKASAAEGTYYYNLRLGKGLRIVSSGHTGDVTIVYRQ